MQIKQLIQKVKIPKDTVRYYERIGIIEEPKRLANGYRDYSDNIIHQLKFIKMAQTAGFTLKQIKPALPYVSDPKPNCPYLQEALNKQLDVLDEKIDLLISAKQNLIDWKKKNKALMYQV